MMERIDVAGVAGKLKLLRSIEFVKDTIGHSFCPRCSQLRPLHEHNCELAQLIGQIETLLDWDAPALTTSDGVAVGVDDMTGARVVLTEILAEREHQIRDNGWDAMSDDLRNNEGQLARAAAATLYGASLSEDDRAWLTDEPREKRSHYGWKVLGEIRAIWPWRNYGPNWKGRRKDLIRGLAMGVAEVERIDRIRAAMDAERNTPLQGG